MTDEVPQFVQKQTEDLKRTGWLIPPAVMRRYGSGKAPADATHQQTVHWFDAGRSLCGRYDIRGVNVDPLGDGPYLSCKTCRDRLYARGDK